MKLNPVRIPPLLCLLLVLQGQAAAETGNEQKLKTLSAENPVHITSGSLIVAEGDSLTYGLDATSPGNHAPPINNSVELRSSTPYPESLAHILGKKVKVENRGFPGDQSVDGIERWKDAPEGQLALILYGTNDCANLGENPDGSVSLEKYRSTLRALVERHQAGGAQVVIMTPPPLKGWWQEMKLKPYRGIDAEVASASGAYFFDTLDALRGIPAPWVDVVHLKPAAYRAIASALAKDIVIEPSTRDSVP